MRCFVCFLRQEPETQTQRKLQSEHEGRQKWTFFFIFLGAKNNSGLFPTEPNRTGPDHNIAPDPDPSEPTNRSISQWININWSWLRLGNRLEPVFVLFFFFPGEGEAREWAGTHVNKTKQTNQRNDPNIVTMHMYSVVTTAAVVVGDAGSGQARE